MSNQTGHIWRYRSATAGSTVRITASANSGYTFSKWSDNDTNASRDIVVNADVTLQAIFVADSAEENGGEDDDNGGTNPYE